MQISAVFQLISFIKCARLAPQVYACVFSKITARILIKFSRTQGMMSQACLLCRPSNKQVPVNAKIMACKPASMLAALLSKVSYVLLSFIP